MGATEHMNMIAAKRLDEVMAVIGVARVMARK